MSELDARRLVKDGRRGVRRRLRTAFAEQLAAHPEAGELDPELLDGLIAGAVERADPAVWRAALAEAAAQQLGVSIGEALAHPAVAEAERLVAVPAQPTPPPSPPRERPPAATRPPALRVTAVHLSGIEAVRAGDDDVELRLSDAGLDVLQRSTGGAIGRLEWSQVTAVELGRPRRGLRGQRPAELRLHTRDAQASFALPGLSDEEIVEHLQPMLARLGPASVMPG